MDIFGPCGECCGCEVSDGDNAGVACAGVWIRDEVLSLPGIPSPTIPNHVTTAANTLWRDATPLPSGLNGWQVHTDFALVVTPDAGRYLGTAGVRLIGGMVDCDNYAFLEVLQVRPALGLSYRQYRLGQVVDGVETILAAHPLDPAACWAANPAVSGTELDRSYSQANPAALALCWDGTELTGYVQQSGGGAEVVLSTRDAVANWGTYCGVGVGELSASVTKVAFSNFAISRDVANGESCDECPCHCCWGEVPDEILVEISGVPTRTVTNFVCSAQCDEINGTYLAARQVGPAAPCGGDGECRWSVTVPISPMDCGAVTLPNGVTVLVVSTCSSNYLLPTVEARMGPGATSTGAAGIGAGFVPVYLPCAGWSDWITLANVPLWACYSAGIQVRIRRP